MTIKELRAERRRINGLCDDDRAQSDLFALYQTFIYQIAMKTGANQKKARAVLGIAKEE